MQVFSGVMELQGVPADRPPPPPPSISFAPTPNQT